MALFVRMAFYFFGAFLAGQGVAVYDELGGTITINIEDATQALVGVLTFVGAFVVSRIAKARGGKT